MTTAERAAAIDEVKDAWCVQTLALIEFREEVERGKTVVTHGWTASDQAQFEIAYKEDSDGRRIP